MTRVPAAVALVCTFTTISASLVSSSDPAVTVPLCASLTIVTAIQQTDGDYESIKTI